MKHYRNERGIMLVLERGEELIESLNSFAKSEQLTGAWLSGGVGGADLAKLAFYDLEQRQYLDQEFDQPLEILSLQGNLSRVDGQPNWHVHGVLSGRDYQSVGGHVKQLQIALTCELMIMPLETELTRIDDMTTGLKLLADA